MYKEINKALTQSEKIMNTKALNKALQTYNDLMHAIKTRKDHLFKDADYHLYGELITTERVLYWIREYNREAVIHNSWAKKKVELIDIDIHK